MAAQLVDQLPAGDEWLYEAKFDGYRAMVIKDGASVSILSRKGNDLTSDYPHVLSAVAALPASRAVIDGEIVAFDREGRPSFQQLQHRTARGAAIRFFAFDLLHLDGSDLMDAPLEDRRKKLERLLRKSGVEFSQELPGHSGTGGSGGRRRRSRRCCGKTPHALGTSPASAAAHGRNSSCSIARSS